MYSLTIDICTLTIIKLPTVIVWDHKMHNKILLLLRISKVGTNFADRRRPLCRYSPLTV